MDTAPVTPTIPHSREAEEATCGAVLINPEIFPDLHFLRSGDFYIHRHRFIWDAFTRLGAQKTPIDMLTVSEELDKAGQLTEIGGPAYLTALINQVPSSLNAESYGRIVEGHALRRRMINAANQIAQAAYNEEIPTAELEESASKAVYDAMENQVSEGEKLADPIARVFDRAAENAERLKRKEPLELGLHTGYIDLDRILQGIDGGELVVIAGRPGQGKTSLLDCFAKNAAMRYGKNIAMFSQEATNEEKARRFLAMETGIDSQRIKSGALADSEWPTLTYAFEKLSAVNVWIEDTSYLTPAALRAKCLRYANRYGLDAVYVDYLQLMETGLKKENRTQEVSYISRQLKLLAQELKVPLFAVSQLSRNVEQRADKKPILSDLRESGSIEQDSNVVMFIYRPDQYEKDTAKQNIAEIIIAKRRDGATGTVELIYRQHITKFENATSRTVDFGN